MMRHATHQPALALSISMLKIYRSAKREVRDGSGDLDFCNAGNTKVATKKMFRMPARKHTEPAEEAR
jgi:hypothetical protein